MSRHFSPFPEEFFWSNISFEPPLPHRGHGVMGVKGFMGVTGETRVTGVTKKGEGGGEEEGRGGEGKHVTIAGRTHERTRKDRATQPMDHRRLR